MDHAKAIAPQVEANLIPSRKQKCTTALFAHGAKSQPLESTNYLIVSQLVNLNIAHCCSIGSEMASRVHILL